MRNKIYKDILLTSIMGVIYFCLEVLYRQKSSLWMILVGGLCAFLVGRLNEHPRFYNRKMNEQCLIGTVITLTIEFISGLILNVWLDFNIWDYSDAWGNVYGQICLPYALLWFLLMPLAIYVDDYLRYRLFDEEKPIGALENYRDLVLGK